MFRYPVSIITVTYNSGKTLEKFLYSVLKNMTKYDELVLVDNNSKDITQEILRSINLENVKVILNSENLGYSKGINIGIKNSKNPFLIFLNPDIEVTKGWIETLTKHLLDSSVGAVGPLSTYTMSNQFVGKYLDEFEELSFDEIAEKLREKYEGKSISTKLLIGFCLATRKDVLDDVGYLDEDLFLGNDDLEFSWRLRKNGYKLKVAIDTFVYHEGHVSFKTEKKSKTDKLVQESTNILADKLIDYYGYGNVPHPYDLWGISWFTPVGNKYKYMFRIYGKSPESQIYWKNKKVGVVVVNYRNALDTKECVNSIVKQDYEKVSVVVVDNSESPSHWEELKDSLKEYSPDILEEGEKTDIQFKKDVVLIRAKENKGFSAGNNIGIRFLLENNAEFIWILNPDTVVEKDTLKEMLEVSSKYQVPVITCKIKDFSDREKVQYDGNSVSLAGKEDKPDIIRPPSFLSGANVLVRGDVFKKVGLWDEKYFLYFEDNDFFYRLLKNNIKVLYTPFTHIYHKGSTSTGGFLHNPVSMYYFIRSLLIFISGTEEKDFTKTLNSIKIHYARKYKHKKLLKAIILGIKDFIEGKTGKREGILEAIEERKKVKLKDTDIKEVDTQTLFDLAFSNPRKKEYFFELVNRLEGFLTREKVSQQEV